MNYLRVLCFTWAVIAFQVGATSGQTNESNKVDFQSQILPLLEDNCFVCHGPERQESNFRLDVKSRAFSQGDFGDPPIVPGQSGDSLLVELITETDGLLQMPPSDSEKMLEPAEIALIIRWIEEGAVWPESLANENSEPLSTNHWAFQPIQNPGVPELSEDLPTYYQPQNEIDHFVLAKLLENNLRPSPPAERIDWIRRVFLDMHGLQPTPKQVDAFVADQSEDSYSKVIEHVLDSHHYGERWARHWLDVVRFGESTGYEVNRDRANAWYYRDYVINSLNQDKPYTDFVIEQLAGDAVGVDEATGFLVGGPYDIVKSPDINLTLMQREDELADYVHTTSTAFLGLTVACARCHNHKFDPILQSDYYSLQAVFAGVQHGERKLESQMSEPDKVKVQNLKSQIVSHERAIDKLRERAERPPQLSPQLEPVVNAKLNTDRFTPVTTKHLRFSIIGTNASEPCIDELEVFSSDGETNVAAASNGAKVISSGDYAGNPKHKLIHINDGRYGNDFSWISNSTGNGWIEVEFAEASEIDRVDWARDREGVYTDRLAIRYSISVSDDGKSWQEVANSDARIPYLVDGKEPENAFVSRLGNQEALVAKKMLAEKATWQNEINTIRQSVPTAYVGNFMQPKTIRRLYRGDPLSPKEIVKPDTLQVMGTLSLDNETTEQQRRLVLAKWIASDENPLTARVLVNRVWHYHFGRGLVGTPSDFGKAGLKPSHPELLDWLAYEFMQNGWSLKWLHHKILSSATYQQASRPNSESISMDADSRWLWRFPPRRLAAESIRDCVLQISGKLNPQQGGPGFLLFKIDRENVHHYFPLEEFTDEHFRRMIYMTKIRQEQDEVFGVFDCPDGGQTIPNRSRSTTALQALNLLNSKFMLEQAEYFATRLRREAGQNVKEQIILAFELAFSRAPTMEELDDSFAFASEHGLEAFCRAILNANEFLFVS